MDSHISIRDSVPDDAEAIFDLRCDPRLKSMQYQPTFLEKVFASFAVAPPGPEIPTNGWMSSTILADAEFAGYIHQRCTTDSKGVTSILLGWDLIPELWGMGIMVRALDLLFDRRVESRTNIDFVACCFATNHRSLRVIEKLGFVPEPLTFSERSIHFVMTWGRERVLKFRLTYDRWRERRATRLAT